MEHYKFKCKVCSDGRLYAGGWCHESIIPDPRRPMSCCWMISPASRRDFIRTMCGTAKSWSTARRSRLPTAPDDVQTEETEVTYT